MVRCPHAVRTHHHGGRRHATIHASIDVDAPLEFVELEWSEFMLQSLLNGYARGLIDEEPLLDEDDMKAGDVAFPTEGDRLVSVEVRLDYRPRSSAGADVEVLRAQATLERDLERYRRFVTGRCQRLSRRPG
jgi:hypothetical protein